jgi:hypothetical protein
MDPDFDCRWCTDRKEGTRVPKATQIQDKSSDLPDCALTDADKKLDKVCEDHIHLNDGAHLSLQAELLMMLNGKTTGDG